MRSIRTTGRALAAGLALGATAAQAAVPPCLTETEAQAVFQAVAPDAIDAVGQKCAAALPPAATLRAGLPALVARYRVAGDAAWPVAGPAIAKLGGADMKAVDPAMLRPMVGPMIGQMASDKLKPKDCVLIDRIVTLLAPLPPANTAGLIVVAAEAAMEGKQSKSPLPICPAAPPAPAK